MHSANIIPSLALLLFAAACTAQDTSSPSQAVKPVPSDQPVRVSPESIAAPHFYQLNFTVRTAGEQATPRTYTMIVADDTRHGGDSIRAGARVPYASGPGAGKSEYYDVGVNIDCRDIRINGGKLIMGVTADISNLAEKGVDTPGSLPLIHQNRWSSLVSVPLGRPTVLFSSDDLTTNRRIELELTATPIQR